MHSLTPILMILLVTGGRLQARILDETAPNEDIETTGEKAMGRGFNPAAAAIEDLAEASALESQRLLCGNLYEAVCATHGHQE